MIKGALHIHSDVSPDSNLPLVNLKKIFKSAGYSFILLTEHAEDLDPNLYEKLKLECSTLSEPGFLIIPGLEIKWQNSVHLLAYGARFYHENENDYSLKHTIKSIRETTQCGLLVWGHVNHPARIDQALLRQAALVDGIEVFNIGYHGFLMPDAGGLKIVDFLKKDNHNILAVGGLDLHNEKNYAKMLCLTDKLDMLDKDSILTCFKKGEFAFRGKFFTLKQIQRPYNPLLKFSALCVNTAEDIYRRINYKIKSGFNGIN